MSFFFIGVMLLLLASYLMRKAIKSGDQEGIVGLSAIIMASVILILFFGLFFQIAIF